MSEPKSQNEQAWEDLQADGGLPEARVAAAPLDGWETVQALIDVAVAELHDRGADEARDGLKRASKMMLSLSRQHHAQLEGVWNPNGEGEQPFVPGGNAKDQARSKQPVIAYACMYPKLAAIAREHGYALAMHGSLVADCDLIAVPWIEDAKPHDELAQALSKRVGGYLILDTYENRPAGVRKHVIHLGGGPYIDLAVFDVATLSQQHHAQLAQSEANTQHLLDTCVPLAELEAQLAEKDKEIEAAHFQRQRADALSVKYERQWGELTDTKELLAEAEAELTTLQAKVSEQVKELAEKDKEIQTLQSGRWRTFRNSCPRTYVDIPMTPEECTCVDCVEIRNAREVIVSRVQLTACCERAELAEAQLLQAKVWAEEHQLQIAALRAQLVSLQAERDDARHHCDLKEGERAELRQLLTTAEAKVSQLDEWFREAEAHAIEQAARLAAVEADNALLLRFGRVEVRHLLRPALEEARARVVVLEAALQRILDIRTVFDTPMDADIPAMSAYRAKYPDNPNWTEGDIAREALGVTGV